MAGESDLRFCITNSSIERARPQVGQERQHRVPRCSSTFGGLQPRFKFGSRAIAVLMSGSALNATAIGSRTVVKQAEPRGWTQRAMSHKTSLLTCKLERRIHNEAHRVLPV